MKITALKPQEKRKNRVSIYLDGSFGLGLADYLLIDFNLYVGREISKKEIEQVKRVESEAKAMEKAYRLLSFRMRSEAEIKKRLEEKFDTAQVSKVISRLKDLKYINDSDFAVRWVNDRKQSRGKRLLSQELWQKGIKKEEAKKAISTILFDEELQNAFELICKKKSSYFKLPSNQRYKKVFSYLERRGFEYPVIKEVLNKINQKTP